MGTSLESLFFLPSLLMNTISAARHAWVDHAKGICIVAVVTLYTTNHVNSALALPNWMNYWIAFAQPFRMPDFFLLSGLFLARVIDRPWKTYLDKKVLHYLYFLVLWTVIILPFTWSGRGLTPTPVEAIKDVAYHLYQPWAMLWFILMLPVYFVVTRLTRWLPWWLVLGAAAGLQMFPIHTPVPVVNWFGERYVFFYAGYLFARHFFSLASWAQAHAGRAMVGLLAWALVNGTLVVTGVAQSPGVLLGLGFAGSAAVMVAAALLARLPSMNWLQYLGRNSIVVYLGFYLPMHGILAVCLASGVQLDPGWLALGVGLLCIGAAVALRRITRDTWAAFLFERPRWAHLPGARTARAAARVSRGGA